MSSMIKPGITLLIIASIAAGILGYVNQITIEPIAKQQAATKADAMKKVMENAKSFEESIEVDSDLVKEYAEAKDASGNTIGYVISAASKGYGGNISLVVGVNTNGEITGVNITGHSETPGLGANAKEPAFIDQYTGKSGKFKVVKLDPKDNEIQAITASTITSKAVTKAVNGALEFYDQYLGGAN